MKIILFTSLSFFLAFSVFGQVSGKLTTPNGQPLPFANVLVLNAGDSTLVRGMMTTESGDYVMGSIPAGQYFMRYSAIGYQTRESAVFTLAVAGEGRDFGTQILEEAAQELEAVVVRGEKPLYHQEIDRTVINVESSVMTKGSSALQLLERSPGVYVDLRNSTLSLNGKSSVIVMLNGKSIRLPVTQVMAMLNGMSANDIEKIELLTTPPSRYDADGSAGMINIVLKKRDDLGTTGSASASGGYGWGEKGNASVSLSHNTGNMTAYGSYAFLRDRTKDGWAAFSTQDMPAFGGALSVDVSSRTKVTSNSHNVLLGMDFHVKKTAIGGSAAYNTSHGASDMLNQGVYTILESDSVLRMEANTIGKSRWSNGIANVYLEKQLREGEKLNVDLDYLRYDSESPTEGYTTFFDREGKETTPNGSIFSSRQKGVSNSPIQVGVVKLDYTRSLTARLHLEGGVKGTLSRSKSLSRIETLANGAWTSSARYMNDVAMKEHIGAAYASLHWNVNPRVRIIAGARYEYSHTYADADKEENKIDRRLSKLFPSFFLSKKLNNESELQLSYTKRISRPSYNDLASYLQYNDPMSVSTGNPSLRPTVTHNIKVGYTFKGYSFSLLASRDDHPIILYQLKESAAYDLMYHAPQNMAYQNSLTLQTSLPVTLMRGWTMSYGFVGGLRQFRLDHTEDKLKKTYFTYSLNGSQTFFLPKRFSLEVSGWYNSLQYEGSKKIDRFGMLNAGFKKELSRNWGSLQLSVTDLLKSMRVSGYFGALTKEAFSLQAHYVYGAESASTRIVKLTYTRTLGHSKAKGQGSRGAVSNDEQERIRKN
jgi:hypothetical protein